VDPLDRVDLPGETRPEFMSVRKVRVDDLDRDKFARLVGPARGVHRTEAALAETRQHAEGTDETRIPDHGSFNHGRVNQDHLLSRRAGGRAHS
jgi:hypothetical protein